MVFDPDAQFTLATEDLHYRHLVSPYLGENLTARCAPRFSEAPRCISKDRSRIHPLAGSKLE